jgi:hypothetical protein
MLISPTKLIRRCVALLVLLSATLPAQPSVAPAQGVPLESTATPEAQLSTMPEQVVAGQPSATATVEPASKA